jgi:hypothetical protein
LSPNILISILFSNNTLSLPYHSFISRSPMLPKREVHDVITAKEVLKL